MPKVRNESGARNGGGTARLGGLKVRDVCADRIVVSALGPDDYFVTVTAPATTQEASPEQDLVGGATTRGTIRLDRLLLAIVVGVVALASVWFFVWRSEGVDGHASSAAAFVASFPEDWHCQSNGDIDSGSSVYDVDCPAGTVYFWFNPLPTDVAQNTMYTHYYQCIAQSGTAIAYIRFSVAQTMTENQLDLLILKTADSFAGDASLIGPDCP